MPANQFVWYELVTSDIDAALSFYGKVIGWGGTRFPGGNERYVILNAKSKGVGGVMALPDGMTQPFWMGYVGTADIDSAVAKFTSSGRKRTSWPLEYSECGPAGACHRSARDWPRAH